MITNLVESAQLVDAGEQKRRLDMRVAAAGDDRSGKGQLDTIPYE